MSRHEENMENNGIEPIDITAALNDFVRMLRKKWLWLILLVLAGGAGTAFYQHRIYVPEYTAYSTYTISTTKDSGAEGNYYDTSAAQQIEKTFPHILGTDILQRRVAEALGMDHVPGKIRAEVMPTTNLLTISVTDSDPKRAHHTLEVVLETYPEISESILGKLYTELMDESGIPLKADNPENVELNLFKGGIAGLLIGSIWIILLLLTGKTVRNEEDCLKKVNTKCIGEIPYVRKKARSRKVEQHLNIMAKNADPEFVEAFRIIRNKAGHSARKNHIKTILITSALPGEGKSSVAVNAAIAFAQEGRKTALIDCDLRHPSDGAMLSAPEGPGLIDYLMGEAEISDCILEGKEFMKEKLPLFFIRGGKNVADGSRYLATEKMKQLVKQMEEEMDYVILDSAPAGLLTDAGIIAQHAQGAVFVIKKEFARVDKILEGMEHLNESNIKMMGCILNGTEHR